MAPHSYGFTFDGNSGPTTNWMGTTTGADIPGHANTFSGAAACLINAYPTTGNFSELFALRNTGGANLCGFEMNDSGTLYYNVQQVSPDPNITYTETNLWTDGYTGWFWIAWSFGTNTQQVWIKRDGEMSWTQVLNLTQALQFVPSRMFVCLDTDFPTVMVGSIYYAMMKAYGDTKTSTVIQAEGDSRSLIVSTNDLFFNPDDGNTAVEIDSGPGGNDWTLVGSAANIADDPWPSGNVDVGFNGINF